MPHEAEYLNDANYLGGYRVVTLQLLSYFCNGQINQSQPANYYKGPSVYKVRSASQRSPRDRLTGWRMPKPYTYVSIRADQPPSGFVGYNRLTCPTKKWLGIPANVPQVWPWSVSIGETPFERNKGIDKLNLQNWVKTKALSKLNRFDINLGETFGERKQTYRLVMDFIRDIRWFWRRLRMGDFASLYNYLRYNFDPWKAYLQCRYGWRPLVYDILGAIDLVEKLENGSYERLHVYVKSHKKMPYNGSGNMPLVYSSGVYLFAAHSSFEGTEKVKVRYDYYLKNQEYVTAASLGLGVHTLWELESFSFLVDWILNIGRWLEAFSILPGWTYKCGSMSTIGDYTGRCTIVPWNGHVEANGGEFRYKAFTFKREIPLTPPLPSLAINPAIFETLLSDGGLRILDAVALLVQDAAKTKKYLRGL